MDEQRQLIADGYLTSGTGDESSPSNDFVGGLTPSGLIINRPVIAHPSCRLVESHSRYPAAEGDARSCGVHSLRRNPNVLNAYYIVSRLPISEKTKGKLVPDRSELIARRNSPLISPSDIDSKSRSETTAPMNALLADAFGST
jgi:hypothetical protein